MRFGGETMPAMPHRRREWVLSLSVFCSHVTVQWLMFITPSSLMAPLCTSPRSCNPFHLTYLSCSRTGPLVPSSMIALIGRMDWWEELLQFPECACRVYGTREKRVVQLKFNFGGAGKIKSQIIEISSFSNLKHLRWVQRLIFLSRDLSFSCYSQSNAIPIPSINVLWDS